MYEAPRPARCDELQVRTLHRGQHVIVGGGKKNLTVSCFPNCIISHCQSVKLPIRLMTIYTDQFDPGTYKLDGSSLRYHALQLLPFIPFPIHHPLCFGTVYAVLIDYVIHS